MGYNAYQNFNSRQGQSLSVSHFLLNYRIGQPEVQIFTWFFPVHWVKGNYSSVQSTVHFWIEGSKALSPFCYWIGCKPERCRVSNITHHTQGPVFWLHMWRFQTGCGWSYCRIKRLEELELSGVIWVTAFKMSVESLRLKDILLKVSFDLLLSKY